MGPPVRKGSQSGGFREKLGGGRGVERFVDDSGRRRIGGGFGSHHGSAKQGYGVKQRRKTQKNPTHARKLRKQGNKET